MARFPETVQALPAVNDTQIATFRAANYPRMIQRINILGPIDSTCALYIGAIGPNFFRDGSATGIQDTGEYQTPLPVPSGHNVYLVWDISTPQATGIIQWDG